MFSKIRVRLDPNAVNASQIFFYFLKKRKSVFNLFRKFA